MYTTLFSEYIDTLRCACYCAPQLPTKGQTHCEAGTQSYGPLEREAAGLSKGDSYHLDILILYKLEKTPLRRAASTRSAKSLG